MPKLPCALNESWLIIVKMQSMLSVTERGINTVVKNQA